MDDSSWMPPTRDGGQVTGGGAPGLPSPTPPPPVPPPPAAPLPPTVPQVAANGSPWSQGGTGAVPGTGSTSTALDAPVPGAPEGVADANTIAVEPAAPKRKRSKALVGVAALAVIAVGTAGIFAVSRMSTGAEGGAATPDELGVALMTAFENEDALGVIDVLVPGERDLLRQPAIDLVGELTRLEVLSPEADLSGIAGFDVVLDNEVVDVRSTNVDDIVNIQMVADATITVDGAAIPVGALVTDNMNADDVTEMRETAETEEEEFELQMTAVQHDGRWYFSLFHTLAEVARARLGPDTLIPVQGIGAQGAATPDEAVEQMLDGVEALDVELLVQTLNPGEAAALQRYAPLFLDEAEDALADAPLEWAITTREYRVEGDGSQRTVFFDAIGFEGTFDGEAFSFSFDGDCFTADMNGETVEQCASDVDRDEAIDEVLGELPAVQAFLDALTEAFADLEPIGLELREFDGLWYVSPVSSLNEALLKVLRALDRAEIDRLVELGEAAVEEGADQFFGDLGDLGDLAVGGDALDVEEEVTFGEEYSDDGSMETATGDFVTTSDDASEPAAWEACYEETDPAAATACFQISIDAGEIDASYLPIELRFPECGYADVRWAGQLYDMTDAEFIAAVEAARPCFLALVEAGAISEFELPNEIAYLECFEGRNWYTTFDDAEYDERYYACIDTAIGQLTADG